ncbi:MAG: putative porin [Methylacidiphilales bacterium]|nr:putative porin [Candidatus Methylacidiphilales bacterium]
MKNHSHSRRKTNIFHQRFVLLALSWCCIAAVLPVRAADEATLPAGTSSAAASEPEAPPSGPPAAAPVSTAAPTENVVVNLINLMVKRGLLLPQDAENLVAQAETEAAAAREKQVLAQAQAGAAKPAPAAGQPVSEQSASGSGEDVRVTYVPEFIKDEMRDQIKQDVLAQAREENWAAPRSFPEWAKHFRFNGDVRMRYEGDMYPQGNDTTGGLIDFNAINKGSPFDTSAVSNPAFFPTYNADQDRNRIRLRARFGMEVDLTNGFTTGLRVATGETNSPTSQNQSFGLPNAGGQGGDFSNYAIWLDRGFIKYETGGQPDKKLAVNLGRFDNPFFSPSQLVWDSDLAFDGLAVQGRYQASESLAPFGTIGGFPIFNTDLNFASNQPQKFRSEDKWLLGAQGGVEWKISKDFTLKTAAAFYDFENIEGRLSSPKAPLTSSDAFDTDGTRPSFAQKGNTYMALRNIVPDAYNSFGTQNMFQYYGLATPFKDLVLSSRLDYSGFDPLHVWLSGEYVKNVAFDRARLNAFAQNNLNGGPGGSYAGGDSGWTAALNFGSVALQKRWDWNANFGYKRVESDAVVDGFTDSDFGGGGTNLQGYSVGGNVMISPHITAGLNWMSATSVAGPTFGEDVFQFDINAKF